MVGACAAVLFGLRLQTVGDARLLRQASASTGSPPAAPDAPPTSAPASTTSSAAGGLEGVGRGYQGELGGVPLAARPGGAPLVGVQAAASVTPPLSAAGLAPVVRKVPTTDPVIFVTIDDGIALLDPRIGPLLREHRLPVSLFVLPDAVAANLAYFEDLRMAGAVLHGHSYSHRSLRGKSAAVQRREICGAGDYMERTFGERPTLFRPPYGEYDNTTRRVVAECGLAAVAMWHASGVYGEIVVDGPKLAPGMIVINHFREDLYGNLVLLMSMAKDAGLSFGRLESYLAPSPEQAAKAAARAATSTTASASKPAPPTRSRTGPAATTTTTSPVSVAPTGPL
ncbi:MAG: polysaccharide deacetylase family protein [Acidimicrobiales bacterium]